MKLRIFLSVLIFLHVSFAEDFITKNDYAKLLYSNPRGIGCNKCHGEFGEGSVIARYKHKGENKELVAPKINNISKEKFINALKNSKSIMPDYSLTDEETDSLYSFVSSQNNQ